MQQSINFNKKKNKKFFSHKRKTNRGNIIDIQFVFPEQNSEEVLEEITAGLTYSGLFQGISKKTKKH